MWNRDRSVGHESIFYPLAYHHTKFQILLNIIVVGLQVWLVVIGMIGETKIMVHVLGVKSPQHCLKSSFINCGRWKHVVMLDVEQESTLLYFGNY